MWLGFWTYVLKLYANIGSSVFSGVLEYIIQVASF